MKMEGLNEDYTPDVELVKLLNDKGIYSVDQLAAILGVDTEQAELLVTPAFLLYGSACDNIPYLLLIHFLGLDIPWLVKKIVRIERRYNRPQLSLLNFQ